MNKEVLTLQTCETNISEDALETLVADVRLLLEKVELLREQIMPKDIMRDDEGVIKPAVARQIKLASRRKRFVTDAEVRKALGI